MEFIPKLLIVITLVLGSLYSWYRYWKKYRRYKPNKTREFKNLVNCLEKNTEKGDE